MAKKAKRPKPYRTTKGMKRFGILNRYGDFWTPETFLTEAEAKAYIDWYWKSFPSQLKHNGFKVVPARVTVSAA